MRSETSILEMAGLLQEVIHFLYNFVGLAIMVIGYMIILGIPVYVYKASFNLYKSNVTQGSGSTMSDALIHTKALAMSLFSVIISILIVTFIFKEIIGIDISTGRLIASIMKINNAF